MNYTSKQIIDTFLSYFIKNKHTQIPNKNLIPKSDPTLLFINSGMAPMKNVFLGAEAPVASRMCNVQTCIRTNDIESVGDRHHLTCFHMLGSWSINDYEKKQAIEFAFELLTKGFGIPKEKLFATAFMGDKKRNLPADTESIECWKGVGVEDSHIIKLSFEDNFWRMGDGEGPCGPCTEMFYDTGSGHGEDVTKTGKFDDKKRYLEIWNAGVFMEYFQHLDGTYSKLKFKSIDTGAGVERFLLTLNGCESIYDTEVFAPIIRYIEENAKDYNDKSARIISDHIRASIYILNSGLDPSNVRAGYILRNLIRRSLRHARTIGLTDENVRNIVELTLDNAQKIGLAPSFDIIDRKTIVSKLIQEQEKFSKTLEMGLKIFRELIADAGNIKNGKFDGAQVFRLYDTFGFPFEITKELCDEQGIEISEKDFNEYLEKHKELSRGGSDAVFKSGLSGTDPQTIKLHTATHLLHAGLKKVLGDKVNQMGSNITPERLRFDFNFERKVLPEELVLIEQFVNAAIAQKIDVARLEMTPDEAKKSGAIGLFDSKYGDVVSVYKIGNISFEICSGPHVQNTYELGKFRIAKEESSSANVRRIKAVLE